MLKSKNSGPMPEVILPDFSDDDNTTTVTKSRRVSFGTNIVKEFIVGSAVSAQCMLEYEQAFPSSDSSNADSSHSAIENGILNQSTFAAPESQKSHRPAIGQTSEPNLMDNRPKLPKFSSTICFNVDSPTADMEFTEGCLTLAKSILDKKNKEMTVIIQAKSKDEEKAKSEETKYFDGSQFEMSVTRCLKPKENKREEREFESEKTKLFGKFEDEMSFTKCKNVFNYDERYSSFDDCKEYRIPLDAIIRHLDKDDSDLESDLFNPEKTFNNLFSGDAFDFSNEKSGLNESMDITAEIQPNLLKSPACESNGSNESMEIVCECQPTSTVEEQSDAEPEKVSNGSRLSDVTTPEKSHSDELLPSPDLNVETPSENMSVDENPEEHKTSHEVTMEVVNSPSFGGKILEVTIEKANESTDSSGFLPVHDIQESKENEMSTESQPETTGLPPDSSEKEKSDESEKANSSHSEPERVIEFTPEKASFEVEVESFASPEQAKNVEAIDENIREVSTDVSRPSVESILHETTKVFLKSLKRPVDWPQTSTSEESSEISTSEKEPYLVDVNVIENLKEMSKEPGCVWSLEDFQHPQPKSPGWLSFRCTLLESTATMSFYLKISKENNFSFCSSVTNREVVLNEEKQFRLPEYQLVIDFGFQELKKYFEESRQKVETIRLIPYFLDQINLFIFKTNSYLRQIYSILTLYPGSRLTGSLLSFRLYSFPIFFSSLVSVDLSNLFRLSDSSLSFAKDFGVFDETKIREIFEKCLKSEDSLCEFVVLSTKYLFDVEKKTGHVTKRTHIHLLPADLKL